jgi:hypothetical protein
VLDLHTVNDVLASMREIFPEKEPPERLRLLLEDIFSEEDDQGAGQIRVQEAKSCDVCRYILHGVESMHSQIRP